MNKNHILTRVIRQIKNPGEGLSQRTARGGFWVFLLRMVQQLFGLARLLILARLLAPHDFGLMGIALLTMSTLETFSQTGFQQALIQKKEDIESYLDAAWTVLIVRGLVLFGILYFIAPFAASFFKVPEAKPIIQVIGLAALFQAVSNIGVIYFQKELEFNKEFLYQLAGTLADFSVAIIAVLILRNVWALALGLLAGNAVRCMASYWIHPYRPRLSRDLAKVRELFGFGKWILGSSILTFLILQGDNIFVGKLLGVTALGFYQMAYRISNLPATEITHVISSVTFPVYSKLQEDIPRLREAYLKILQVTAFLSFPVAGLIFILATDFAKVFLGEKWMPMVPAMQILVFAGLLRSIAATAGYIFYAIGKPKIDTRWQIIRLFILGILIYPFSVKWGINGVSFAVLLSILFSGIGFAYKALEVTNSDINIYAKTIILPLIGTGIMVLFISKLKIMMGIGVWQFLLFALAGGASYYILIYLSDTVFNYKIRVLIKESLQSLRGV